jgi:cytochrome c peroxidase
MSGLRMLVLLAGLTALGLGGWWLLRNPEPEPAFSALYMPAATDLPVTPIPARLSLDARKVALGKRLFHDKRLSHDDSTACASCHRLDLAGQDARPVAVGIRDQQGSLNSPTIFNSGFNFRQFWDGRAATLEEQAEGPVHNSLEMDSNWDEVQNKLRRDHALAAEFEGIWADGITPAHIQEAIAEFERSLITPDSPFDRYLLGDQQALDASAQEGWRLFRDLGCISCHQGTNLGGNLYANLGVMGAYFADRGTPIAKSDLGRYNVTGREADKHVFKVPGLRNITKTGPYFHDGSMPTLDRSIEAMARYQLGIELSHAELNHLLVFLESLNGLYQGQPL